MKIIVMGIGNILLRDEGVGVRVAKQFAEQTAEVNFDDDIDILDGGTLSFSLAPAIGEADRMIIIDAAQLEAAPGTVQTFIDGQMDTFLGTRRRTVHEVSLLDLMDMARLNGDLPRERALIAIQPGEIDWGSDLTPEVETSVDGACRIVDSLIHSWNAPSVSGAPNV